MRPHRGPKPEVIAPLTGHTRPADEAGPTATLPLGAGASPCARRMRLARAAERSSRSRASASISSRSPRTLSSSAWRPARTFCRPACSRSSVGLGGARPLGGDLGLRLGVGDLGAHLGDRVARAPHLGGVGLDRLGEVAVAVGDDLQQVGRRDGLGQAARLQQHEHRVGLAARVEVAQAVAEDALAQGELGERRRQPLLLDRRRRVSRVEPVAQRRQLGVQARRALAQRRQPRLEGPDAVGVALDLAGEHALAAARLGQPVAGPLEPLVDVGLLVGRRRPRDPRDREGRRGARGRRAAPRRAGRGPPGAASGPGASGGAGGRVDRLEVRVRVDRGPRVPDLEVEVRRGAAGVAGVPDRAHDLSDLIRDPISSPSAIDSMCA